MGDLHPLLISLVVLTSLTADTTAALAEMSFRILNTASMEVVWKSSLDGDLVSVHVQNLLGNLLSLKCIVVFNEDT
jgi:hypothetical protein